MECTRARATRQASVAVGAAAGALLMFATASCIWVGTEKTGGDGGTHASATGASLRAGGVEWEAEAGEAVAWDDAVARCAARGDGWRLPTMTELLAAAGAGNEARSFEEDGWFWSQTPGEIDGRAWAVTSDGATNANRKTTRAQVRCVR